MRWLELTILCYWLFTICVIFDGVFETYYIIKVEEYFKRKVSGVWNFDYRYWLHHKRHGYPVQEINGDIYQRIVVGGKYKMKCNRTGDII